MDELSTGKKYKCVFFDLDHTLWDYETNCRETLYDLYSAYQLDKRNIPDGQSLYEQFKKVNTTLWDLYDRQLITQDVIRKERFKQVLDHFGAYEETLSNQLSDDYLEACPKKPNLMPYAEDVLHYLSKKYQLTIITNGFEKIQHVKLASGKISSYFKHIITSQKAGHRKPSPHIFEYAVHAHNIQCCDAIMIGDNLLTDIQGARGCTIDTVFYNPERIPHQSKTTYEIGCLSELLNIL